MHEVEHNPDKLIARQKLLVSNAQQAYKRIQRLMDVKRLRGMRLRYAYDIPKRFVMLEARNFEPIKIAERTLRDAKMIRKG